MINVFHLLTLITIFRDIQTPTFLSDLLFSGPDDNFSIRHRFQGLGRGGSERASMGFATVVASRGQHSMPGPAICRSRPWRECCRKYYLQVCPRHLTKQQQLFTNYTKREDECNVEMVLEHEETNWNGEILQLESS